MGDPFTVTGGDVNVSPERVMGEVTIAPRCIVRVPSVRKSHQDPMPSLETCSATQWPTGVSVGGACAHARPSAAERSRAQTTAKWRKREGFAVALRMRAPMSERLQCGYFISPCLSYFDRCWEY